MHSALWHTKVPLVTAVVRTKADPTPNHPELQLLAVLHSPVLPVWLQARCIALCLHLEEEPFGGVGGCPDIPVVRVLHREVFREAGEVDAVAHAPLVCCRVDDAVVLRFLPQAWPQIWPQVW